MTRRADFPIFEANPELVYLDSTATTQKPAVVIAAMQHFLSSENATVNRGIYGLSYRATTQCERIRGVVQRYLGAARQEEIIFVKGTTEALNLVAQTAGRACLGPEDEALITQMEHHANIVPWQQIVARPELLKVCPITEDGALDMAAFKALCSERTKVVAMTHASNVLGTVNDIKALTAYVKAHTPALVVVDGAQAASHLPIDVVDLDCDFYCFSGHKCYGPTGIGVLYGKYEQLCNMPPYQTGGDMIETVTFQGSTFAPPPAKFEAGTPAIVEIIGLGAALEYLTTHGVEALHNQEQALFRYAMDAFSTVPGLTFYGTTAHKLAIASFTLDGVHSHDVGTVLDQDHVAIRVGHHCAQPLMAHLKVPATARVSLACYNTPADIDRCVDSLKKVVDYFK